MNSIATRGIRTYLRILYSNHLTDDLLMDLKIFEKYLAGVGVASLATRTAYLFLGLLA
jgi:hypothetical protein